MSQTYHTAFFLKRHSPRFLSQPTEEKESTFFPELKSLLERFRICYQIITQVYDFP